MQYLGTTWETTDDLSSFPRQTIQHTVIQVNAPTTNTKETEVDWFFEDLQDLLELTPRKNVLFLIEIRMQKQEVKRYLD